MKIIQYYKNLNENNNTIINKELNNEYGRYVGQVKFFIGIMATDMKVIGKMIKEKEKEFIIIKMVKDMKVILKLIKGKERKFIIIIMVIDMKGIIKMVMLNENEFFIL